MPSLEHSRISCARAHHRALRSPVSESCQMLPALFHDRCASQEKHTACLEMTRGACTLLVLCDLQRSEYRATAAWAANTGAHHARHSLHLTQITVTYATHHCSGQEAKS